MVKMGAAWLTACCWHDSEIIIQMFRVAVSAVGTPGRKLLHSLVLHVALNLQTWMPDEPCETHVSFCMHAHYSQMNLV